MTDQGTVRFELRSGAAWLTLNRPASRNALSPLMIDQLRAAVEQAEEDAGARVIVLTGEGSAFCAGADLKAGKALQENSQEVHPFAQLLRQIVRSSKPVISAVNGSAFGGGLGLLAASDIAIASQEAVFSFSEVRLGLIPAMISVVVVPKIGRHHASRLFLTGHRFSAEEACTVGLVHQAVEAGELERAVQAEVEALALGGPRALAQCKRLLEEIAGLDPDEGFRRASALFTDCLGSEEGKEGMTAFAEKRKPRWCS